MAMIWSLEEAQRQHCHSPGLAAAIRSVFSLSVPVLDLGCGPGHYLLELSSHGFHCLGVEGTAGIQTVAVFPNIVEADLSKPLVLDWPASSVLCIEVAEHLYPQFEPQLLANINAYCQEWLVISWAIPGQLGHGHHNCRPNSYVYDRFIARGFDFKAQETFLLRDAADLETSWFKSTLFVFCRRPRHNASV